MSGINTTVANYIADWNETDSDRRRDIIARTWTETGSYLDEHRDSTGHDAIDVMIAAVQQMFPAIGSGCRAGIDLHHDRVRFRWQAGGAQDSPLFFAGTDFATIAPDGRFNAVTGFTDAMPSLT